MRLTKLFIMTAVFASLLLVVSAYAAEETTQAPQVAGKPADAQYPFIAQVTGNDVYVRSGNSQADYPCTKLDAPARVTVVDEVYGWAKILPPEGTYSWIYKAYVKVDPADPTVGVLTGDNVRVWAGADNIDSGSSSGLQTKLNSGEIVELYPDQPETGDYYRIKPPTGAHLWIHTDYLKYVAPLRQERPIVVPPRPDTTQQQNIPLPSETEQGRPQFTNLNNRQQQTQTPANIEVRRQETAAAEAPKPQQAARPPAGENELLKLCYDLADKIDEQLKKPLGQQDYTDVKKQLDKVRNDPDAGKAAAYAQFLSDRIQRYELAQSVTETLQQQDRQLEQARHRIEQAHQDQLNQVPREIQYLYTGTLKPSHVYTSRTGTKRYLLLDDKGKIRCYLVPVSPAVEAQLQANENATVGVNGDIVSDEKSLVTVVAVTELAPLE